MNNTHKVRADLICLALAKKHAKDFFVTECKNGPTTTARLGEMMRFDAIAIKRSWTRPCITIYEIKVNRNDFLSDEKWPQYKQYCNRFFFVCPVGLIAPGEVANGCGLITYNPETKGLRTAKSSLMMDNPLSVNVFYYIIMSRLEEDRHPFFSDTREYFELLVADREDRSALGYKVKSKLLNKVATLKAETMDWKSKAEQYQHSHELLQKLKAILQQSGVNVYGSMLFDNVKKAFASTINPDMRNAISGIEYQLNKLKQASGIND